MIEVIDNIQSFKQVRSQFGNMNVGLVPTMGNLHLGHLSLIEKSHAENDVTIISIFINPKQFGPNEDFADYPRTLEQDIKKIKDLSFKKKIIIFTPTTKDIFPDGFDTKISVGEISHKLCGASRPGHFDGVTTVVYKLFKITQATCAYFGQKDYQQYKIIEKMIIDLELPIKIKLCPIIRDQHGLALSSRNQYLKDPAEITQALKLNETLKKIATHLNQRSSSFDFKIPSHLKPNEAWEYCEILNADNLSKEIDNNCNIVILGALRVNQTRLIDNQIIMRR